MIRLMLPAATYAIDFATLRRAGYEIDIITLMLPFVIIAAASWRLRITIVAFLHIVNIATAIMPDAQD